LAGLLIAITSLLALGRSFGFVAADRGLKTAAPTPSSATPSTRPTC